jgi:hypothetical protein
MKNLLAHVLSIVFYTEATKQLFLLNISERVQLVENFNHSPFDSRCCELCSMNRCGVVVVSVANEPGEA